ncbi:hypothetical protein JW960_11550 [candidate division KSB1 bacterium]|nr:hypothetical protein [candidate division KSB1 bacterium]
MREVQQKLQNFICIYEIIKLSIMKTSSFILILSNDGKSKLADNIISLGYQPRTNNRIEAVLHDIKHKCYKIIFLDFHNIPIDALEFIFNIRDIDSLIPVIIVNGAIEGHEILSKEHNVFIIQNTQKDIADALSKHIPNTA